MIPPAASYSIPKGRTSRGEINQILAHAERERKARERREAGVPEPYAPKRGSVCCLAMCSSCDGILIRRGTRGEWQHLVSSEEVDSL